MHSPPVNRRIIPTLTEVVEASVLTQYRVAVVPQPVLVTPEQPILQRIDELLTQLLSDEPNDAARDVLAPKFEILKQRLRQEFSADNDAAPARN